MATCVPTWSYETQFYASLLDGCPFEIVTDPLKGKGVRATREIEEGETVHVETALSCAQSLDSTRGDGVVCAHCLRGLETAKAMTRRIAGRKLADCLPFAGLVEAMEPVPCRYHSKGCQTVFCSVRCRDAAWYAHHAALCEGQAQSGQRKAMGELLQYEWDQDGIDYSDTVTLSLRVVAQTLVRKRLSHQSIEESFAPFSQLIRLPLTRFNFAYLLVEREMTTVEERQQLFEQTKADPSTIPEVVEARTEGRTKRELIEYFTRLLHRLFAMSKDEADFFHEERLSELMGAVLLNSQDRSPPSGFEQLQLAVEHVPGGAELWGQWRELVEEKASPEKLQELEAGSQGQGIYAVGCLFNHSCDPNLLVSYSCTNDETLYVTATRKIQKGEELCISYIEETMSFMERQQQLFEHYFFECRCTKCVEEMLCE